MFAVGLGIEKNLEAFVSIHEDSQVEGPSTLLRLFLNIGTVFD
jgi:hypothetical protein